MRPLRYEGPIYRERLHYLDWLRVLAVLGVFYAHTADIFDKFYWHIKGGEQNTGLLVLVVFGTEWGRSIRQRTLHTADHSLSRRLHLAFSTYSLSYSDQSFALPR